MKIAFLICIVPIVLASCNIQDNASFVRKYENEDFSAFINTGIHFRGVDKFGNSVLMVSTDLKNAGRKGPIIITVNRKSKTIKEISFKLSKDSLNVDQTRLRYLVLQFLKYKVFSLMVDSNNNVFLRLSETDDPTLARFSEPKYITTADTFKGDWKHFKGSWYKTN